MAKLTAWLMTLIGLLWVLQLAIPATFGAAWVSWIIGLAFLVIGVSKLMRNYGK